MNHCEEKKNVSYSIDFNTKYERKKKQEEPKRKTLRLRVHTHFFFSIIAAFTACEQPCKSHISIIFLPSHFPIFCFVPFIMTLQLIWGGSVDTLDICSWYVNTMAFNPLLPCVFFSSSSFLLGVARSYWPVCMYVCVTRTNQITIHTRESVDWNRAE